MLNSIEINWIFLVSNIAFYVSYLLFIFSIGYYIQSSMQWYSYKLYRVLFHYNKPLWHLYFFILPAMFYCFLVTISIYFIFLVYIYPIVLYFWYKRLDKPLKFTARVKRFFIFLFFAAIFTNTLYLITYKHECYFDILTPIVIALVFSRIHEKILFNGFKKSAGEKLKSMGDLRIVAITASYGKTSIKNFLYHILSAKLRCYKTSGSVNTINGIIMDINTKIPKNTEIYVVEAGAREKGDIKEIADFLKPDVAIVGQIGAQHIEYFKTLKAVISTKMELVGSQNLKKAFVHLSANADNNDVISTWGDEITFVNSSLDGVRFGMMINGNEEIFETKLLGAFNAVNLAVCIQAALYFGIDLQTIRMAILTISSVEHRLQRIDAGGKIILDDSFNGNFDGMKGSYELAKTYNGRRVLITPGVVESTKEENEKLAKIADKIFDIIIITAELNSKEWIDSIKQAQKILLKDKSSLEKTLAQVTRVGDLILFSNDTPSYM